MKFQALLLPALLSLATASPIQLDARGITTWKPFTPPTGLVKGTSASGLGSRDTNVKQLLARDYIWVESINAYRRYVGIPTVSADSAMMEGAYRSMQEAAGQAKHSLYSGALAQVIASGPNGDNYDDFNDTFIGAWLCEVPEAPGLDGRCSYPPYNSWTHGGETGHYSIVTNTNFRKVGCAFGYGLWFCNFA